MKQPFCSLNGAIIPLKKASIDPYDLGFLRGYGAFDVMRAIGTEPLFFAAHLKRLRNSLAELDLALPSSEKAYRDTILELLRKNGYEESFVRTIVTGGIGKDSMTPGNVLTILILIEKRTGYPETYFEKGVKVITLSHARHLPLVKTSNYIEALRHTKLKTTKKATEILYVNADHVLEASTSNIFIVKDGVLITPKDGILHGITRATVLALARKGKIPVEERPFTEQELWNADECFLTATGKEVLPVVLVDTKKIGSGKVGEMTIFLLEKYRAAVSAALAKTHPKK